MSEMNTNLNTDGLKSESHSTQPNTGQKPNITQTVMKYDLRMLQQNYPCFFVAKIDSTSSSHRTHSRPSHSKRNPNTTSLN